MQENTIPVLILRHQDEVNKSLNTVNLLIKGLSQVEVWDGVNFSEPQIRSWISEKSIKAPVLLYPKPLSSDNMHYVLSGEDSQNKSAQENNSIQENKSAKESAIDIDCLIVLDGTWRNTREILIVNAWLKTLNTLSLVSCEPSRYLIRQAREESSLSTIEAVGHVLAAIEKCFDFSRLVHPFHQMIEYQIERMGQETFQRNYLTD